MTVETKKRFSLLKALEKIMSEEKRKDLVIRYVEWSPNASEFGKKAVIYLIKKSNNFTSDVWMTIDESELANSVANSIHDMNSANGDTEIYYFMKELGFNKILWFRFNRSKVEIGLTDERYDNSEKTRIIYKKGTIERIQIQF